MSGIAWENCCALFCIEQCKYLDLNQFWWISQIFSSLFVQCAPHTGHRPCKEKSRDLRLTIKNNGTLTFRVFIDFMFYILKVNRFYLLWIVNDLGFFILIRNTISHYDNIIFNFIFKTWQTKREMRMTYVNECITHQKNFAFFFKNMQFDCV